MTWEMGIALALIAAGVWAAWLRVKRRRVGKQMAGWRAVQGTVLSHAIEESVTTDAHNDREWHYDPRLTYQYETGGTERTGKRISLDGVSFSSRKKAQVWLDQRPVGSTVTVYLDPADPDEAVLETGVKGDWWVPVFFVALGIAVALGLFG